MIKPLGVANLKTGEQLRGLIKDNGCRATAKTTVLGIRWCHENCWEEVRVMSVTTAKIGHTKHVNARRGRVRPMDGIKHQCANAATNSGRTELDRCMRRDSQLDPGSRTKSGGFRRLSEGRIHILTWMCNSECDCAMERRGDP